MRIFPIALIVIGVQLAYCINWLVVTEALSIVLACKDD